MTVVVCRILTALKYAVIIYNINLNTFLHLFQFQVMWFLKVKLLPGVECQDTESGPRCGSCPGGYYGNGKQCIHICDSQAPCGSRPCRPSGSSPFYKCEGCSAGQEWRGNFLFSTLMPILLIT